jgi:hypothetical protein
MSYVERVPAGRPAIPAQLQRDVKEEAGYACAIPTCRSPLGIEIAHIEPWAKVRQHEFHNLILLCSNHHRSFDDGDIPKASILHYKLNLAVVNGRYGSLERRLLQWFADNDAHGSAVLPASTELLVSYLVRDGLIEVDDRERPRAPGIYSVEGGGLMPLFVEHRIWYRLTPSGHEFLGRWMRGDQID